MIMKLTEKRKKRIDKVAKLYGIPSIYPYSKKVAQIILTTLLAVLLTVSVIGFPILLIKDCAEDNVTTAYAEETYTTPNLTYGYVEFNVSFPLYYGVSGTPYYIYDSKDLIFRMYDDRVELYNPSNRSFTPVILSSGNSYSGYSSLEFFTLIYDNGLVPSTRVTSYQCIVSSPQYNQYPSQLLSLINSVSVYSTSTDLTVVFNGSLSYQFVLEYPSVYNSVRYTALDFGVLDENNLLYSANIVSGQYFYDLGYEGGKDTNFQNGYNDGLRDGKEQGIEIGREQVESTIPQIKNEEFTKGYNKAVDDLGSPYTFDRLLDSIFYAPLKAISSVLNFEILGVNVYNLVNALFTLMLVIIVVKIVFVFIS